MKNHTRVVKANGAIYPTLPKYEELAMGHVKSLLRHLRVDMDCIKTQLPEINR